MRIDPIHSSRRMPAGVIALLCGAALAGAVLAVPARAAEPSGSARLSVGDALPSLSLRDQHDTDVSVDASVRLLLLTRDMDAGALVKEALADRGRELLASAGAVYVSDVSGMPGFVRSMFALPALRKRPYAIALDEDGHATAAFPYEKGHVTILHVDGGRIASISQASTSDEVRSALQP